MAKGKRKTAGGVDLSWLEWLVETPPGTPAPTDPRERDAMSFITWLIDPPKPPPKSPPRDPPGAAPPAPTRPEAAPPAPTDAPTPWPERSGPRPGRPTRTQRRDATEYALARLLARRPITEVASDLRIHPRTLIEWILLALEHPRCALRRQPDGAVSLDLPSGTCLPSASLDEILALEQRVVFNHGKLAARLSAALGDQLRALQSRITDTTP